MGIKSSKFVLIFLLIAIFSVGNASGSLANSLSAPSLIGSALPPAQQGEGDKIGPELEAAEPVHLFWHEAIGGPASLGSDVITPSTMGLSAAEAQDPKQIAQAFLQTYSAALQIAEDEEITWSPIRVEVDASGSSHVFLQQTYNGLPIFGGEIVVHITDMGVAAANGEYLSAIRVSSKPDLSIEAAYKAARNELDLANPVLIDSALMIYNPALLDVGPSANHLAYHLQVGQEDTPDLYIIFVDAHSGKLLFNYNNLQESKNREIYDLNNSTALPGSLCHNESGPAGGSPSADCLNAFNFTGDTYDYFLNTHSRDSFNNSGATMRASVRYGTTANAFWNGSQTAFGPGFATKDVVAHEWTHAVTQYTAGLVYAYQPGALNESMSDIFGAMVDRDDWLMGEDTPIGAIRSLADPTAYGDPGKVSDSQFYCGTGDNGGVHINSGVPNHTAYLMAQGGTYNGRTITGIGRGPTERIFYRALTTYLTSNSGFNDAYNALNSACADLYGSTSATCTNVRTAAQATEMDQPVCGTSSGIPDSFEDDDVFTRASTITVNGSAQNHTFHDAGDNDWVKFSATASCDYVMETSNLGSRSDTFMYLYNTNGTSIITYDDDGGSGLASRIAWTAASNGTYYVRVRNYHSGTYGSDTGYTFRVTSPGCDAGGDSYEPDDTYSQASTINVNGSAQSHNFHDAGDNDWAKFSATAGNNYIIETLNLDSRSDTVLYLYGTNGTTIIRIDDDGGTGLASRIEWTAPGNGVYYVRVRHYSNSVYGAGTDYDLRITTGGVPQDSYEDDDAAARASTINVNGSAQTHNFHDVGDNDWVKFSATAGDNYVIETFNLASRSDTVMYLYDTDSTTLLAYNDDGGDGLASRISWAAPANGTYYIRIRHYSSSIYGTDTNYSLRVTGGCSGGDSYEPDGSPGQARTIAVNGSTQTHNFFCTGDNDWVKFSATAGMDYVIETFNLGSDSDTYMYLIDTDGTTILGVDDDGGSGLASRIAWTAPANGTYYVRLRHYSAAVSGSNTNYDLRVTSTGAPGTPDAYEDDDAPARASTLTVNGSPQTHNFHDAGDNDWVKFSASTGTNYVMETFNLSSRSDTYLCLYNTNSTTLIVCDDDGGSGLASRIAWTAPANGTYYVRVYHYSSAIYGANTNYDLRVTSTSSTGADTYEPDDTLGQASNISPDGSTQNHNFHDAGDNDWVRFSASSGVAYTIETLNLGPRSDTVMCLYATDGITIIACNDDGGGGLASRITWTAPANGTYYVRVYHYSSSIFGTDTNYDLRVVSGATGGDSYEPDDTYTQASPITVNGSAQTHNFHFAGDNDWVQFSATTGTNYVIETFNLGSSSDTYLYLYNTDGTSLITQDDDGGAGLASRIEWTAPANGTYYVRARHYSSSSYGPDTNYDLRVTGATSGGGDSYEPDNTYTQASLITVNGSAQTHNFHVAGDNDWVQFSASASVQYVIETFNLGSLGDTYMYLYSTDGTSLIAQDDDGGTGLASRIEWTAPANGTYYVRLRHYSSSIYGADTNYDLRITSSGGAGPDTYEPDDTYTQATPITADGSAQTHNFHDFGDNDWVQFPVGAGNTCILETSNLGGQSDTYMDLYSTDGTTLLASNDDGGVGLASRIVWTFSSAGTYYARVRHYSSAIYGAGTNYDLAVSCSSGGIDAYEPDDTYTQAKFITVNGSAQTHNFHVAGDNDWVQFSATMGTNYIIETFNLGSLGDTYMYLYNTDGTSLIAQDDDSGTGLASRIEWTAPANGTYYARLRHYSSGAYGPDTNYDLRVTTASNLSALAATVEFTDGAAQLGDQVEATVYIHQAISAIKVDVLAKSAYLNLTEAMPLSPEAKELGELVTADADRWQMTTDEDGRTSIWYGGKADWDGNDTYPVLRLRWQLAAPLPTEKLAIFFSLTTVDQNGQATSQVTELPIVMLGGDPKIDQVQPTTFSNAADTVLSVQGSNFDDTAKLYLTDGTQQIQLMDVVSNPDIGGGVLATVPAGAKPGTYKLRLVNPDSSSTEYDGDIQILEEAPVQPIYLPLILRDL